MGQIALIKKKKKAYLWKQEIVGKHRETLGR